MPAYLDEKTDSQQVLKQLRQQMGMNRREFCDTFDIPYRTVTEWERGNRNAPGYVLRFLEYYIRIQKQNDAMSHTKDERIETDRLLIRHFAIEDAKACLDGWGQDSHLGAFIAGYPMTGEQMQSFVNALADNENSLFGWEGTKTSMQVIFSATSLLPYNIGQLQWANMLGGCLLFLSTICFTLFLSACAKNNVSALAMALIFVLLPLIAYMAIPGQTGEWIQALLPGAGIGLSNSFLYGMLNFDFLHLGSASFWNTDAMLVLALVKIPLFIVFAILIYDKKKIRN